MRCPTCDADTKVYESRPKHSNATIRRWRKCPLNHRFVTIETLMDADLAHEAKQRRLAAIKDGVA